MLRRSAMDVTLLRRKSEPVSKTWWGKDKRAAQGPPIDLGQQFGMKQGGSIGEPGAAM